MDEATLLSMKEFSNFTGVRQSTLRYYDQIGLLPPVTRKNKYRYYVPYQIIVLNFINVLITMGVPLSIVDKMTAERTPENMIQILSQQEVKLNRQLLEIQTAFSIIHTFRQNIQAGLTGGEGAISVQDMDEFNIILGPENSFEEGGSFYKPFINFCNSAPDYRINLRYPIGGYHKDMKTFLKAPGQPDKFFSLDPYGNQTCKAGKYLVGYKRGYYGQFADIAQRMDAYAQDNNLVLHGPVYVIYLLDEISVKDPSQYLARIAISVTKKRGR
ncbi:MAG: MerR family DNA-binding transcriptional regulator [Defluviitaleaceae bacterium]|nr:MerR family DNA-binding transcriptional regulator [Defluviitaleaceae bacterium]